MLDEDNDPIAKSLNERVAAGGTAMVVDTKKDKAVPHYARPLGDKK